MARQTIDTEVAWALARLARTALGLIFLAAYFWNHPFRVDPLWIAAHFAIVIGVTTVLGLFFLLVLFPLLARLRPGRTREVEPPSYSTAVGFKRKNLWQLAFFIPAEDGLFFVPLLWAGITPVTAAIAAALYAASHYPKFTISNCALKFVYLFGIALMVLPHGLGSVVVAHLALDAIAIYGLSSTREPEETPDRALPGWNASDDAVRDEASGVAGDGRNVFGDADAGRLVADQPAVDDVVPPTESRPRGQ